MNNHPGYSHPRLSSPLFPAYGRQQTSPSEIELESLRKQLYDSNAHFQMDADHLRASRLTTSIRQNHQFPRDLNSDPPVYRHENNARYDFQKEQDFLRSQRFSEMDRRNLSHFRTGDIPSNMSRVETHQSQDLHSNYSNRSYPLKRMSPYDDFNDRERPTQRLVSETDTRITREHVFNRFPKEVDSYPNNYPLKCDYSDSSSLRSQSFVQDGLYGDIQPGLSREEEILKEIKALQQQQKLQELLNVSLSLAKQRKSSTVLGDFDRESSSNNTSSSIPETFNNQDDSKEVFLSEMQDSNIFPTSKPFIDSKSNPNDFNNSTLDRTCDSSIPISKSTELKDSIECENASVSSGSVPNTVISESKVTLDHESSEQDNSIPFDSVNDTVLNKVQNSSTSNSSGSEWPITYSIPFLGETTDNQTAVNDIGLKSNESQKLGEVSKVTSIHNQDESGESNKLVKSNLEDALVTLEIVDPVVGLDFIIENKNNVSVDGSFPFCCQLCNSSITRSLIIDHILSYNHRLKYVQIKDEALYEHIVSHKVKQCEKEEEVYKAAEALENIYGRGHVVVLDELSTKEARKRVPIKINFRKVHDSPKPEAFELNKEIDLEQQNFSDDANVKKENPIFPDGIRMVSPTEAPADIPKSLLSHAKSNDEFRKQVSPIKSDITKVSTKNESLVVKSPLKQDSVQKSTSEAIISSKFNPNNALVTNKVSAQKRPASPFDAMLHKRVKTEEGSGKTENKPLSRDISLHKDSDLGDSPFSSQSASQSKEEKSSLTELLQNMNKWEISTNEEAEMISKTVDVLLKLLLNYKLRQEPSGEMEKLMKSFLSTRMENLHAHSDMTKNTEPLVESKRNTLSEANENLTALNEAMENENSNKTDSEPSSLPQEDSKTTSNPETTIHSSQPSNKPFLQPPPFFCWPKSSTPTTSTTTSVETKWTSQYSAAMYAYAQQGYAGVPSMYQPYTLPMAHCVAPVPLPMPPTVAMVPIPPPPKSVPPPLPSMKRPPLPPPPPPPSGPSVLPLPIVGGFQVPPLPPSAVDGLAVPPLPPSTVGGLAVPPLPPSTVGGLAVPPLPPSTEGPPMPPLPPSVNRPPLPP